MSRSNESPFSWETSSSTQTTPTNVNSIDTLASGDDLESRTTQNRQNLRDSPLKLSVDEAGSSEDLMHLVLNEIDSFTRPVTDRTKPEISIASQAHNDYYT